ncbi:hypothetical protein [Paenibacillus sp. FSL H8-0259]|uniref:hypothetical protein n=1 Tax=Paenibacillus sp. FSL H8-0259 TaxID=1920423 RepID=UPI00096C8B1D|nr:hypothetical protein [Paenibacillus sp. FSL H8-0259]OMF21865.1 hypothetical protein BK132_31530 [Paenibacillus sp. FSL H8-0259]
MKTLKVGVNCKDYMNTGECNCSREDFPYGSVKSRVVCEIIKVDDDEYVNWMEVFTHGAAQIGLTVEDFKEKYSHIFYAEDDKHRYRTKG